ncbi:MAG TPA: phosphate ABC transporter substrate-binding protein PstS [Burkholderiaceae bacterium]
MTPPPLLFLARLAVFAVVAATGTAFAADPGIRGAGATFPFPIYVKWAADYKRETGVDIGYSPIGSGGGVQQLERGLVDFGASDAPLARPELTRLGALQFPAVIGGVVPVVNISGIRSGDLKLTGSVLADIFLGKIGNWNDSAIVALNPGLNLPNTHITVVHRFDASGTTFLWSEFLSGSNPDWKRKVGAATVLDWPVGVAETGNEGVASSVQRTRTSIGYVEYAYAKQHRLSFASLQNRDGQFVAPSRAAFEAAALSAPWRSVADLDQLLIDQAGAASWPITGASFVVLRTRPDDAARTVEVMRFFDWAQRRGKRSAIELDYVPMPDSAVESIAREWKDQVRTSGGEPVWPAAGAALPLANRSVERAR